MTITFCTPRPWALRRTSSATQEAGHVVRVPCAVQGKRSSTNIGDCTLMLGADTGMCAQTTLAHRSPPSSAPARATASTPAAQRLGSKNRARRVHDLELLHCSHLLLARLFHGDCLWNRRRQRVSPHGLDRLDLRWVVPSPAPSPAPASQPQGHRLKASSWPTCSTILKLIVSPSVPRAVPRRPPGTPRA